MKRTDLPNDFFRDYVNPTADEIRSWAFSSYNTPMQDWELVITDDINLPTVLMLAADTQCPKREFMLSSLYVYVGDKVRANPKNSSGLDLIFSIAEKWMTLS